LDLSEKKLTLPLIHALAEGSRSDGKEISWNDPDWWKEDAG